MGELREMWKTETLRFTEEEHSSLALRIQVVTVSEAITDNNEYCNKIVIAR